MQGLARKCGAFCFLSVTARMISVRLQDPYDPAPPALVAVKSSGTSRRTNSFPPASPPRRSRPQTQLGRRAIKGRRQLAIDACVSTSPGRSAVMLSSSDSSTEVARNSTPCRDGGLSKRSQTIFRPTPARHRAIASASQHFPRPGGANGEPP